MSQSRNVITKQRRMHNYYPSFVITNRYTHPKQWHTVYILIIERIRNKQHKQEPNRNN